MGHRSSSVSWTRSAAELIHELVAAHGPLLLHKACEDCSPMCFLRDDFPVDDCDVLLGDIEGCPLYITGTNCDLDRKAPVVVDAVPGRAEDLSLEAFSGRRFVVHL